MFATTIFCAESSTRATACTKATEAKDCPSFGQYCKVYSQCGGKGNCDCKTGYSITTTGGCGIKKLIGAVCDTNSICATGSVCTGNRCTCPGNTRATSDNKKCIPSTAKQLGETCTTAAECTSGVAHSTCGSGTTRTCQCDNGYKVSGLACIQYTNGEACGTNMACATGLGLKCQGGTCKCPGTENWYDVQKKCIFNTATKNIAEGRPCDETSNTKTSKFCSSGLTCTTCPLVSGTPMLCRKAGTSNGAESITVTLSTVTLLVIGTAAAILH